MPKNYSTPKKKLLKKIVAEKIRNNTKFTKKQVMKEAGYSESTATSGTPEVKKTWKELMDTYFPDDVVAKVEQSQLNASEISKFIFPATYSDEEIKEIVEGYPSCKLVRIRKSGNWKRAYYAAPDNIAVAKSLDRIYKLKGQYAAEKVVWTDPADGLNDEELDKEIKRLEEEAKQRYKKSAPTKGKDVSKKK